MFSASLSGYAQTRGQILPVTLSYFSATRNGSSILINWKTESEISNGNFEIEISFDNVKFVSIASVKSHVNSSTTEVYSYTNTNNTFKTVSFYRLKIARLDGSAAYSDIQTVKGFSGSVKDLVIFPNPSNGNAKITLANFTEPENIQVIDNTGRLIKSILVTANNSLEVNNLMAGTYLVRVTGILSGNKEIKKLSVIN